MSITYAQLNNALLKLGFDRQEYAGKHYVYFNEAHDTLLTFPILSLEMGVRPAHLMTARKMVVEKGIADEDTWEMLLCSNRVAAVESYLPPEKVSLLQLPEHKRTS